MVTLRDIASRAGISIGTVDRVLHNRGRVAEKTRKRVLGIIEKSGYQGNIFASNLANSGKRHKFCVVMPHLDQDSSYWRLIEDGLKAAAFDLKRYGVDIETRFFDRYSGVDFRRLYFGLDGRGHDGYFMAPVISDAAESCFRERPLIKPYAFFDCHVPGSAPVFYIGQDSFQGGMLGGKMLHLLVGDDADVVVTRMLPEGWHINDRVSGFRAYFEERPGARVREYDVDCRAGVKEVESVCRRMLEGGRVDGLFVTNANTHMFAYALERLCGAGKVKVVGYDLVSANRFFLENESISFVISQNPVMQAQKGLNLLCRHVLMREELELEYVVPLDLITKENLP
ncbi:MAG: LacI family DNA-binding transcriptional regulator [Victivallales bacterium]|nr:LacI family DNA-binding transcriptional regulator [Victivallales bacterium]